MKTIDVIYSPICEANGAFLEQLEEWLKGTDVKINYIPYDSLTSKEVGWYKAQGTIREKCKLVSSVFIDVFYNEKLIATVPLKKEKIEQALNIHIKEHEQESMSKTAQAISVSQFRAAILKGEIEWIPITIANYEDEMTMCLKNYPYGNPPKRFHKKCVEIKKKVFLEVLEKENIAGIYAKYQGKVIGLLEIFPREIMRKYGFLTGNKGDDEDYLTVGCYEVGFGIPRKEMIDELMFQLEKYYSKFIRTYLEGIGVFEWNEGFMPYWVYDKYDFHKTESIKENTVVMEKEIYEYR
ncbi:hypothetical protein [Clostridium guangxiense]|uniref:hypothetical protein n=1 Tax=Clostridium guangxiense TaxID=1662055 RepID=UPI001E425E20|nr:hypothetical protein [Clostridium guangxiense]MCD2346779.1 hypothetical protein [Clostridium guangxiense]